MVKKDNRVTLDELARECANGFGSPFKAKVSDFRVCTLENGTPLDCVYRKGGWRNLEQRDGARKIYGLCTKGYMPISERVARYFEEVLPLVV